MTIVLFNFDVTLKTFLSRNILFSTNLIKLRDMFFFLNKQLEKEFNTIRVLKIIQDSFLKLRISITSEHFLNIQNHPELS